MHSQPQNQGACAPSKHPEMPFDDCCIEGSNFKPGCNPERRSECFARRGNDLQLHADLALAGIEESISAKPSPSLLVKRLRHLTHCLLGAVPGFSLLPKLWFALQDLREKARQDPRGAVGLIRVRIPGCDPKTAVPVLFDLVDDAPDGY